MNYYSLSPSALADSIGVPRSSISHLLTGRNKPSLDFVLKLIRAYPDVNLYWLLNGKGTFPSKKENSPEIKPNSDSMASTPFVETEPETVQNEKIIQKDSSESVSKQREFKKIKKIVFFFEDGSFEPYYPN